MKPGHLLFRARIKAFKLGQKSHESSSVSYLLVLVVVVTSSYRHITINIMDSNVRAGAITSFQAFLMRPMLDLLNNASASSRADLEFIKFKSSDGELTSFFQAEVKRAFGQFRVKRAEDDITRVNAKITAIKAQLDNLETSSSRDNLTVKLQKREKELADAKKELVEGDPNDAVKTGEHKAALDAAQATLASRNKPQLNINMENFFNSSYTTFTEMIRACTSVQLELQMAEFLVELGCEVLKLKAASLVEGAKKVAITWVDDIFKQFEAVLKNGRTDDQTLHIFITTEFGLNGRIRAPGSFSFDASQPIPKELEEFVIEKITEKLKNQDKHIMFVLSCASYSTSRSDMVPISDDRTFNSKRDHEYFKKNISATLDEHEYNNLQGFRASNHITVLLAEPGKGGSVSRHIIGKLSPGNGSEVSDNWDYGSLLVATHSFPPTLIPADGTVNLDTHFTFAPDFLAEKKTIRDRERRVTISIPASGIKGPVEQKVLDFIMCQDIAFETHEGADLTILVGAGAPLHLLKDGSCPFLFNDATLWKIGEARHWNEGRFLNEPFRPGYYRFSTSNDPHSAQLEGLYRNYKTELVSYNGRREEGETGEKLPDSSFTNSAKEHLYYCGPEDRQSEKGSGELPKHWVDGILNPACTFINTSVIKFPSKSKH